MQNNKKRIISSIIISMLSSMTISLACFGGPSLPPVFNTPACNESTLSDPLLEKQWHLKNLLNDNVDINIGPVWENKIKGEGVSIAIVDDGLDIHHEDLRANINLNYNYNYLDKSYDTTGSGSCDDTGGAACHGTSVAGVAAAIEKNDKGGRGAAPCSTLMAFNLLQDFTSENQLDAMIHAKSIVGISNNSWGPADDTGQLQSAEFSWTSGIEEGLATAREGKGILYVWAAGNGAGYFEDDEIDNSNYDEYANFYGVMAVAAIGDDNKRSYYSERGANVWVSTYSSGGERSITTTDVSSQDGYNDGQDTDNNYSNYNYTNDFGGTSSAAPLASGIASLVLSVNPEFSWRDLKMILALSSKKIDELDKEWSKNAAGLWHNYKYGFGSLDAAAAVKLANSWTTLSPMLKFSTELKTVNLSIPDNDTNGIESTITVSSGLSQSMNKIEFVSINIEIDHPEAGELEIILTSSSGTESILAQSHSCYENQEDTECTYFDGGQSFRFSSVRNLNENPNATWTLNVKDLWELDAGSLKSWSLTFYGRNE